MGVKKILRIVIGVALAAFFVWLISRQIHVDELKRAFVGTKTLWVIAGLFFFLVGYVFRVKRWHLMLKIDNPDLKWHRCAGPLFGSFALNNLLPLRSGDVLRAFAFNSHIGVGSSVVMATLLVERLLDMLMVVIILYTTLIIFNLDVNVFADIGSLSLLAIAAGILFFLLFPQLFMCIAGFICRLIMRVSPKIGEKLLGEIDKVSKTLMHISKRNTIVMLILWSILVWSAEGCVFWFAAMALPSIIVSSAGWLALPIGTLATLIPGAPGYVGTFDYFVVKAMSALGNGYTASVAYALLVHLLLWLPSTIIGGLYLLLHLTKKQNKLRSY